MKLSCVVLIIVCAMATIAAQVNSVQTATTDASALGFFEYACAGGYAGRQQHARRQRDGQLHLVVWLMTWTNDKGDTGHATLHIQQKAKPLMATANVQGGPKSGTFRLTGNVRGNQIVLSVKVYWHHASFTGTVDGSKMSGSSHDGRPWEATKS